MSSFRDRVVLVTGAASGIGRQLARDLASEGARVAAVDRSAEGLDSLAQALPGHALACATADVTDLAGLRDAVAGLESRLGPADVLIASAGIGRDTPAEDFRAEDFNEQVRVNLVGVINSIDCVLPGMCRRRAGQLVVLSSLASYRGLPRLGGYCASKAGVNALLDSLRVELRPLGVAVTTVCPGWVRTPLTAPINLPPRDMMEVGEASRRILDAVRARRPFVAFPAGSAWRLRLLRYLPRAVSDWLAYRLLRRALKLRQ